ncbi:30S ribosomal protein S18, partial [Candidatus Daviesbacteria bacterium RIFCSPHIGHO2_01_FULL_38_8b]
RLLTDRAKITPRLKNGLCSKHQRFATREIKYARHLGLLPFTPKV